MALRAVIRAVLPVMLLLLPLMPAAAHAETSDETLVEGAKLCTRYLPRNERKYGIPLHLLSAIATTESGRWHKGLNMALPWPWTVNAEGKGYYFDSKQEAMAFVQKLKARGVDSMDVGCMQVNLRHHPDAFANIGQAFEPAANVNYAAQFLRSNYDEERSWRKAAGNYHSRTPEFGNRYIGSVFKSWQRIIEKVRLARASGSNVTMANAVTGPTAAELADTASPVLLSDEIVTAPADPLPTKAKPARADHKPVRMRVIEVSRRDDEGGTVTRMQGVKIIRPSVAKAETPKETEIASALPAATEANFVTQLTTGSQSQPKVVHVSSGSAASAKTGPRFIFN